MSGLCGVPPTRRRAGCPAVIRASSGYQGIETDQTDGVYEGAHLRPPGIRIREFGRLDFALIDLNSAVELDSTHLDAYFNRGSVHHRLGEFGAAVSDFDKCIRGEPETAAPYYNRAAAHHALGDTEQARSDIEEFILLSKDETWIAQARQLLAQWGTGDGR